MAASSIDFHLEIDSGERLKIKLYDKRDDLTSLSSVAIFQHHQRTEYTFRNSYVILELVPSVLILWIEISLYYRY